MYKKLFIILQKYWIVKKVFHTLKKNSIHINSQLQGGRIKIGKDPLLTSGEFYINRIITCSWILKKGIQWERERTL